MLTLSATSICYAQTCIVQHSAMALQCTKILQPYAIEETFSAQSYFEGRDNRSFLWEKKASRMLAMLALLGHDPHLSAVFSLVSNPRTSWVGRLPRR